MTRGAMSSCTHSTRSAEQRWPALLNADDDRVVDDLLGQRRAVDDHRVLAAGFGDQRHERRARGQRARDRARDVGRAGERDARDARIGDQRGADDLARARQQREHVGRHAGRVQASRPRAAAISGVCSAGFATTALPAASAAATWPVKIASGKFHGQMHANTPRPCSASVVRLAGGRRAAPAARRSAARACSA